jgi:hypothetical protein
MPAQRDYFFAKVKENSEYASNIDPISFKNKGFMIHLACQNQNAYSRSAKAALSMLKNEDNN